MKELYYGDNITILRDEIADESVDLIYLDPPFNSKATYNVLFKSPEGIDSEAQIEAFEDTWHWTTEAEQAFDEVITSGNTNAADMLNALRSFLGENDMMAYLTMMAVRLIELHRVLKKTGSLYLHCDPTASHFLRILLDAIFGSQYFRSEIIWRRTGAHNKSTRWAPLHDVIFFCTKSDTYIWNNPKQPYMLGHVNEHFKKDNQGYKTAYYGNVLTGSGIRGGQSGKPWKGFDPTPKNRHWAIPSKLWDDCGIDPAGLSQHEKMDILLEQGLIKIISGQAWPIYERRIQPGEGPATGDIWAFQPYTNGTVFGSDDGIDADVSWIKPKSIERLGYPTQKPLGLLERIIEASSNPGDLIMDPFCGCGTAVHAAEKLGRNWIGIDITHLAISLIEKRLKDAFPGITYDVHGTPKDLDGAKALATADKYQFQWWAVSLIEAMPYQGKKKGADEGIDGIIYCRPDSKKIERVIVSVKGGKNIGVAMIRDLKGVLEREKAPLGIFVTLTPPTKPMRKEAAAAGVLDTPWGKIPKVQIATIGDLLHGKKPEIPGLDPTLGFKQTKKEVTTKQEQLL